MEQQNLDHLRHSAAHLLAAAVMELFPDTKRTIGPAIDNGFYYDFDFAEPISEQDLGKIEQKMRELVKSWTGFEKREVSQQEALDVYKDNPYKQELINEFSKEGQNLTFYKSGNYEDLCKGGHIENPKEQLRSFKLLSIAGAYWRGNEKNKMLTRIYGTAFFTKEELEKYLWQIEEAKKRDHRIIGKKLDLFTFSDLVGPGLPLFTPKGTILRDELAGFSEKLQKDGGFKKVSIPHIAKTDLYKKSGHWDKFGTELFLVQSQETDDQFVMKPMNCPHHAQIYASQKRSYKDLPIRYSETTHIYRDEKAGELLGLSRVRAVTQDDAHIFCTMDQIEYEFTNIMEMIKTLYSTLGLKFKSRLSFSDPSQPKKYLGTKENWELAEKTIEKVAKKLDLDYFVVKGEAAFYGPKIDVMVIDALDREWQCATEQLDFVQPSRFELTYTDNDGTEKTPVMIHKALLGSIERFLSVYIEHTEGNFPLWLSPVQVAILPVSDKFTDYAKKVEKIMEKSDIRVEFNDGNKTLGAKIREATLQKLPFMIIIGDKEIQKSNIDSEKTSELFVSVRTRSGENLDLISLEDFMNQLNEKIINKSQH